MAEFSLLGVSEMAVISAENLLCNLPDWVPQAARRYLAHTEKGISFRDLARREGCHPSTILRQVRRFEGRRDDPLVDEVFKLLGTYFNPGPDSKSQKGSNDMTIHAQSHLETKINDMSGTAHDGPVILADEEKLAKEARRVLRRLSETGAVLALASDMDKAVVLRAIKDGPPTRTAVVPRDVAQAFALRDWIKCTRSGRVASYEITPSGRSALKDYLAEDMRRKRLARGERDGSNPFARAHERNPEHVFIEEDGGLLGPRPTAAESPLAMLARRRDREGKLFLDRDLVHAGERFREDFELAQMGLRMAQSAERLLDPAARALLETEDGLDEGARAARSRLYAALDDLGPGLGDIILRCCCLLEGLETAERRMGWSARSGKVVLRIGLQRLRRHYIDLNGHVSAMIG